MKTAATVEKYIRYTLGTILLVVAVNAFGGGYYGISGATSVPVDWLKGTPFHSYLIPGIILFAVVGGVCFRCNFSVYKTSPSYTILILCCCNYIDLDRYTACNDWLCVVAAAVDCCYRHRDILFNLVIKKI